MVPFSRIAREWRRLLIPLAVVAILNLLVYLFAVSPMSRSAAGAERRAETARQALRQAQQEHARAQAVISSSRQANEHLGRFYGDVLPADLTAARRMTYARLAALARETNLLYDRRTFEPDGSYRGGLDRLRITMELEGDYRDVREFIHRLESAPEFVIIEQLALSSGVDEEAPLTLTLQLATYFKAGEPHDR